MTILEPAKPELPLDSVQPRRPINWRAIRHWSIGVAVVAVLVGPLAWWQASARADVLTPGDSSYYGAGTILQAGNAIEYCYPDRPGSTFIFGFSIMNSGGHDVTVRSIDEIFGIADQKITIDPQTNGGSSGPAASTQTLPLTIHPGQSRQLYVAMHLSTDIVDTGGSDTHFDSVTLQVRSLGIDRAEKFSFGFNVSPLWIGISGIDDQGKACDRSQAPSPH